MASTVDKKRGAKKVKKTSKMKRKKGSNFDKLTLDDIKYIDGNEADLKLIGDITGSDDEEIGSEVNKEFDVDPNELQDYIGSLGFKNVPSDKPPRDLAKVNSNISKVRKITPQESKPIQVIAKRDKKKKLTKKGKQDAMVNQEQTVKSSTSPKKEMSPKEPASGLSKVTKEMKKTNKTGAGGAVEGAAKKKEKLSSGKSDVLQHAEVSSTSTGMQNIRKERVSSEELLKDYVPRKSLLFETDGLCFYREFQSDPTKFELSDDITVAAYKGLAGRLYSNEIQIYLSGKQGDVSSKAQWMRTVVSTGVLADKIAALTLQVQTAPLHTPSAFDSLMTMVKKKGRRETLVAMDALRQLYLQEMLPEKRKLRKFSEHPFMLLNHLSKGRRDDLNRRLVLWYYEDQLKQKFQEFVVTLERLSHDTIPAVKQKAMSTAHELLIHKPEQEKILLTLVVNKIGDPDYKVAARAVHLLQSLVEIHTNMKGVVVTEVESLLYRANVSPKAQYYAVCFLNQLILSHDEPDLATKLIIVYFSFFKACMKKKDSDQKMLSAVLTGVNRAYPYSNAGDDRVDEQTDALFKVVHISAFNTAIQALLLLKQVLDSRHSITDRFYSALYSKILDRSVEHSTRQAMFLNLIYQSLRADNSIGRVKAFVKRLLQTSSTQQPPFACGALFLVSEIMATKPALLNTAMEAIDSDNEEHFVDVDEDSKKTRQVNEPIRSEKGEVTSEAVSSWVHHKLFKKEKKTQYDPGNRNPQYCGAEGSIFWELNKLQNHYHPSVALFAKTLRDGLKVHYMGNPLHDFTLMKFLDRFVYRNPKKQAENVRVSVMEPKGKAYNPSAIRLLPVNTKDYLKTSQEKIPIDEMFFHKYFTSRQKGPQHPVTEQEKGKIKKAPEADDAEDDDLEFDSDASSIDDDEFDQIIGGMDFEQEVEEDDDDMDFAGEVSRKNKDKKKKSKSQEEESSDDEDDFGNDSDMEEGGSDVDDDADDDGFKMVNDEFDEEGFDASDEEFEEQTSSKAAKLKKSKKRTVNEESDSDQDVDFLGAMGTGKRKVGKAARRGGKKRKTDGGGDSQGLQATAEEFSSLMDEHVGAKFDSIGLNAMANKDNAHAKQLNWEVKRDQWVQGRDPKTMMAKKRGKGKPFKKGQQKGQPKTGGAKSGAYQAKGGNAKGKRRK
ncbi:CCAAT/enhancer-binding protein zeta-like [Asterias rubens]|uniref:CCAAT/enhancer-binding protein zeta-like n=1 Tax=Asterias rubens TaxID=7604 RepID=UPI001455C337|nr:CCAAT/enhancer-binding protein zeta-like [Asterias rubens]